MIDEISQNITSQIMDELPFKPDSIEFKTQV